jgi:hypothetical protein
MSPWEQPAPEASSGATAAPRGTEDASLEDARSTSTELVRETLNARLLADAAATAAREREATATAAAREREAAATAALDQAYARAYELRAEALLLGLKWTLGTVAVGLLTRWALGGTRDAR